MIEGHLKIIAIEKEVDETSKKQFTPYLEAEAQKIWELNQSGLIREIYFTKNSHNAVLILECTDETEADNILNTLPLVKEKLITFNLFPLVPYNGYSRLFT